MNNFIKKIEGKIFLAGLALGVLICFVSLAIYGEIYTFGGYGITRVLWAISILLMGLGLFIAIVCNSHENVGGRIMMAADLLGFLFIFAGIVGCVILLEDSVLLAFLAILGGLVLYALTWALYGLGQIVDDVHAMRKHPTTLSNQNDELPDL